jgi:hypothetical protein
VTAGVPAAPRPLRLRVRDAEDLAVLSAHLQDAIVPIVDVAFLAADRRFVLVANRFKWEAGEQPADTLFGSDEADEGAPAGPVYLRTNCGIRIEHVTAVRSKGVDLRTRSLMLALLAIRQEGGAVVLDFAGDIAIALSVEGIDIKAEDVGEPWPTTSFPQHVFEDGNESA